MLETAKETTMKTNCHLMVAEKDDYLREKTSGVLSRMDGISMVSQITDIAKMENASVRLAPTLLLIDLKMAVNNKTLLEKIKQKFPEMKIFAMNGHYGRHLDVEGLFAADGYLRKTNIVNDIRELLADKSPVA